MKLKHPQILAAALLAASVFYTTPSASASTVNILWYLGGVTNSGTLGSYTDAVNHLVSQEQSAFNVSGSINTWNVTFWNGGAMPVGPFNVLVTASPEGPWTTGPSYSALLSSVTEASFGSRVMLTGQDADWHYQNFPGSTPFNGPAGFLIDAINWAGSGTGMGGVLLGTGTLGLFSGVTSTSIGSDSVQIPSSEASFPVNSGLTSAGLSNWSTSAHDGFVITDPSKWTAINTTGPDGTGTVVTLVSAQEAAGGTSVPDGGSTAALLGLALVPVGWLRRKLSV